MLVSGCVTLEGSYESDLNGKVVRRALFGFVVVHGAATAQSARFDELANAPLSAETAQTLKDELLFQRATQTYLWAMPAIMTFEAVD